MRSPAFLTPEDQPRVIGQVFGTPLVVKGLSGLPVLELIAWGLLTCVAGRRNPEWPTGKRLAGGALMTIGLLGSEWCHNLAHTLAAWWIGRPPNAMLISFGTPFLVYYDVNDPQVTPSQHRVRALGGPIFNVLLVPVLWLAGRFTQAGSLAHTSAHFAMQANAVLTGASLLPMPFLDGGPILKWSLVQRGYPLEKANKVVNEANLAVGAGLAVACGILLKKRHKWTGIGLAALAISCLAIGFGLLKE
jgi:Zn-dependent protease